MNANKFILWTLRIVPAVILLQTLYFKFTGHPESVALFSKLNAEPYGRTAVGVIELITGLLLLIPATTRFGALLAVGVMAGAIGSHVFVIGIESNGDGGALFVMALVVMVSSLINLWVYKVDLLNDLSRLNSYGRSR